MHASSRSLLRHAPLPVLLASVASPAAAQEVLYRIEGAHPGAQCGFATASAGDVDRDGTPDFIVGSVLENGAFSASGVARVYSGKDGSELHRFDGLSSTERFGSRAAGLGDLNRDGHDDFVITAEFGTLSSAFRPGSARVFSGMDGTELFQFEGTHTYSYLGTRVSALGDVDADGVPDFLMSARFEDGVGTSDAGAVRVYSGADGSVIRAHFGENSGAHLGLGLDAIGDVNRDGVDDYAIGAPGDSSGGFGAGEFYVISGSDGSEIQRFTGAIGGGGLGYGIAGLGDINFDGFEEFAVGEPGFSGTLSDQGRIQVYTSNGWGVVHEVHGFTADFGLGFEVASAGDFNGDSAPDFMGYNDEVSTNGFHSGAAMLFSGLTGNLLKVIDGREERRHFGEDGRGVGDLDGDGFGEIIVGATDETNFQPGAAGEVFVVKGSRMSITVHPRYPSVGETTTVTVADKLPVAPIGFRVVSVNGNPAWRLVHFYAGDNERDYSFTEVVPASASGRTLGIQAIQFNGSSDVERITVQ